jgi:sec-independent protein translocase protein TatC
MKITHIKYYYKYYSEIKYRLFLILLNWLFTTWINFLYKNSLLFFVINSNSKFINNYKQFYFIFTDISEIFYANLKIVFFISNQICLILIIYHLLIFLSLGLYKVELLKFRFFLKISLFTWLISAFVCYTYLIPASWYFFLSFQQNGTPQQPILFFFEAKLVDFIKYFIKFYNLCFFNCQFVICLTILLNRYTKTHTQIKIFRKNFYLIFLLFSTIITPPEVLSQVVITFCLITIYEIITFLNYLKF